MHFNKSPSLMVGLSCALVLAGGSVALAVTAHASVPGTTAPGWTLNFSDDFSGAAGSGVGGDWRYDTGTSYPGGPANFGTGEVETLTSSAQNVSLDGAGNLRITAVNSGGAWTSGRIETNRDDFQPPAGGKLWVESRLRMPDVTDAAAAGYWPAFWMLGTPYRGNWWNWPSVGEIDIMENVNGIDKEWATFHCGVSPGGPCNETTGLSANVPCAGTTCQGGYHTYAMQWDRSTSPETLSWYLDGVRFHNVKSTDVDAGTWTAATNHGYFILLNLAMGGAFPAALGGGPNGGTTSGSSLIVDYVAVWTGTASAAGPPSGSGGGPTPTPTPTPSATPTPTPSPSGPGCGGPPPAGRDAYGTIQAESANQLQGLTTAGSYAGPGGNGDYLRFDGVNFGGTPATQFKAQVASGATGGVSGLVEVRLDSPSAAPLGSFAIANTGGWQSWRLVPANITGVTGTHTVYVTFTSGQPADFATIDWITFGR